MQALAFIGPLDVNACLNAFQLASAALSAAVCADSEHTQPIYIESTDTRMYVFID